MPKPRWAKIVTILEAIANTNSGSFSSSSQPTDEWRRGDWGLAPGPAVFAGFTPAPPDLKTFKRPKGQQSSNSSTQGSVTNVGLDISPRIKKTSTPR